MDPHVAELETLLRTMRHAGGELLGLDAWDRWGSRGATDEERADFQHTVTTQRAILDKARDQLIDLVTQLRESSPDSVIAWATAHIALLESFAAAREGEESRSTEVFVAREEIDSWRSVRRGERSLVDENVFYIHLDPDAYRAAFGIDP